MKKIALLTLIACLPTTPTMATDLSPRVNASRTAIKSFFGALAGELKGALKKADPLEAINVCNTRAMGITSAHSEKNGWQIGRTSLKPRNAANAPDAWETSVLKEFEARKAAGENPKKMEHYEVVTKNGQPFFRYMKAIPTAEKPCLVCHGSNIKPALIEVLDKLYPQDKARGYKAGDIRGAFTITQPMSFEIR